MFYFALLPLLIEFVFCDNFYGAVNLPNNHLPFYIKNYPELHKNCTLDNDCPFKEYLNLDKCWGYEPACTNATHRFKSPRCTNDEQNWPHSQERKADLFYKQTDFGFVKQQISEMSILCEPTFPGDSALECSDQMRFCRGRNLMVNFTALKDIKDPLRYSMEVLKAGDIRGHCTLNKEKLLKNLDHMSPLQSWAPELRFFEYSDRKILSNDHCDIIVDKPTIFMKIDATVNMYHHFCDFFNLYAALHVNAGEHDIFTRDVNILIWESYTYTSAFGNTFDAFTQNPILDLKSYGGKTVCFRELMLPLLPRMIFGLYYNTPVVKGCSGSGLFQAFAEHVTHRLNIPVHKPQSNRVRITLLSRDTKYRRIVNEVELLTALENLETEYIVERVVFNRQVPFVKQLEISRNTDVLIGMHGAGLTHSLFMPEWGTVFELYNCEDANCYSDLTRIRGLNYVTWEDLEKIEKDESITYEGAAHAKFTNYAFDVREFVRLVKVAADHVRSHPLFKEYLYKLKTAEQPFPVIYGTVLEIHNTGELDKQEFSELFMTNATEGGDYKHIEL